MFCNVFQCMKFRVLRTAAQNSETETKHIFDATKAYALGLQNKISFRKFEFKKIWRKYDNLIFTILSQHSNCKVWSSTEIERDFTNLTF